MAEARPRSRARVYKVGSRPSVARLFPTMKLIITGATGNAGSEILRAALESPAITQVTVLSRRPPASKYTENAKLSTILIPSEEFPRGFDEFPQALVDRLKGHAAVVWALGTSQNGVNEADYTKITHDYPLTAAKALSTLGTPSEPFRFIYLSGEGADQSEQSRMLFGRVKGRTEKALATVSPSLKAISLRPAYIIPPDDLHESRDVKWWESLTKTLAVPTLGRLAPSIMTPGHELSAVCLELAKSDTAWTRAEDGGFLPNTGIRKLAKELETGRLSGNK